MKLFATTLLLFLALGASTAQANHERHDLGYIKVAQASKTSLDQAAAQVRKETGGRILSAETVRNQNGRKVHRIKVLTRDKKVRIVNIEAN